MIGLGLIVGVSNIVVLLVGAALLTITVGIVHRIAGVDYPGGLRGPARSSMCLHPSPEDLLPLRLIIGVPGQLPAVKNPVTQPAAVIGRALDTRAIDGRGVHLLDSQDIAFPEHREATTPTHSHGPRGGPTATRRLGRTAARRRVPNGVAPSTRASTSA